MLASMSEIDPRADDAAGGLERAGRERAFADGHRDVATGRRRGLDAAMGDPARRDDRGDRAAGSGSLGYYRRVRRGAAGRAGRGRQLRGGVRAAPAMRWPRALELQRAPLAPIRLRIGVHTGEIQLRDEGNYIGPTINRTARLRDLGHGGQTVLSGATEALVVDRLPADTWLTDLGSTSCVMCPAQSGWCSCAIPICVNDFPPLTRLESSCRAESSGAVHQFRGPRRRADSGARAVEREPVGDPDRCRRGG